MRYNLPSTLNRVVRILTWPSTSIQVLPSNTSNFPIRIFPFDSSSPSTRPQHRITLWSFWRSWHHGKSGIQKLPRFPPQAIAKLAYIIVQRSTFNSNFKLKFWTSIQWLQSLSFPRSTRPTTTPGFKYVHLHLQLWTLLTSFFSDCWMTWTLTFYTINWCVNS